MKRTINIDQLLSSRYDNITLPGLWEECTGPICRHGVVFVWGGSGNGKTSVVLDLCKGLLQYGTVLYVTLEEGYAPSFRSAVLRADITGYSRRLQILRETTVEELDERLSRRRSPEFVVIDSFQYLHMSYGQYADFRKRFRRKLLVFVSHADGKQPLGRTARKVMYDADLKLWVEGYTVFSKGRYVGATGSGTIWKAGADRYWGREEKNGEDVENDKMMKEDKE